MNRFISTDPNNLRIAQILDANLDRAREGLRVLEDWARFGVGKDELVKELKNYRQLLGKHHLKEYKDSRNFTKDTSTGLSHREQQKRKSINSLISANCSRVQEALRVIEEYSRNINVELSSLSSKIRYEIYQIEITLLNYSSNKELIEVLLKNNLYFISNQSPKVHQIIESVLKGGIKIIQHRFKDGSDFQNLQDAIKIRQLCTIHDALFIVNDRVDIALACNADGVHLGQDDIDISSARRILGFSKLIGVSANKSSEIKSAIRDGADYLGIGPVFETPSKKEKIPLGIKKIKEITQDVSIPFFIIGGIKQENLPILKMNGFRKVALISEIANSVNPQEKAIMLIKQLENEN
tara:strand:- start:37 stop:1092 length:1056 start_codon:yes stop_codon:yes gene_type:complete